MMCGKKGMRKGMKKGGKVTADMCSPRKAMAMGLTPSTKKPSKKG